MIETTIPGPWVVDNTLSNHWAILNRETGRRKVIGPVKQPRTKQRINYFDRAYAAAEERNQQIAAAKEKAMSEQNQQTNDAQEHKDANGRLRVMLMLAAACIEGMEKILEEQKIAIEDIEISLGENRVVTTHPMQVLKLCKKELGIEATQVEAYDTTDRKEAA